MGELKVYDELYALGKTSDEIARSLQAKGFKGERRSACRCVLARFIQSFGYPEASVGVRIFLNEIFLNETESVGLAPVHQLFIIEFDKGLYPELEV